MSAKPKDSAPSQPSDQSVSRGPWSAVLSLPGNIVVLMVRGYQVCLGPLMGGHCRFTPSCSNYFIEAVRKYGVFRGSWRGIVRICHCHPFHPGGHDPP